MKNNRQSESFVCKFPKLVLPKQLFHSCFRLIDYISELSTVGPISAHSAAIDCVVAMDVIPKPQLVPKRAIVGSPPGGIAEHCNCAEIHFRTWRGTAREPETWNFQLIKFTFIVVGDGFSWIFLLCAEPGAGWNFPNWSSLGFVHVIVASKKEKDEEKEVVEDDSVGWASKIARR